MLMAASSEIINFRRFFISEWFIKCSTKFKVYTEYLNLFKRHDFYLFNIGLIFLIGLKFMSLLGHHNLLICFKVSVKIIYQLVVFLI